ncbi:MAG: 6-carboxytetrahydropterin synthase [Phycisphaerae bacterium]
MNSAPIFLSREIRFGLPLVMATGATNAYAAHPPLEGLGAFVALTLQVTGPIQPQTGMLVNIRELDDAARRVALPIIDAHFRAHPGGPAEALLLSLPAPLQAYLPELKLVALKLALSPYLALSWQQSEPTMVTLTETFEFAAAHRLHNPALTAEENQRIFGKCNNPNGHGHNYTLEVAIHGTPDAQGLLLPVGTLQTLVQTHVLSALDHKHLNLDTAEFARLNPTVEHIAQVIYERLRGVFPAPVQLRYVKVWETPKTYCQIGA